MNQHLGRKQFIWGVLGCLFLGIFLLRLSGMHWQNFSDFDQLYLGGVVWREGRPPYGAVSPEFVVPNGPSNGVLKYFLYAPFGAMLVAPLTLLPYPIAPQVWLWLSVGLFLTGMGRFAKHVFPKASPSLLLFLVGAMSASSGLRWNLFLYQPTIFVCGAMVWFACCYVEQRRYTALIFALLVSIKFSYLLPLVGLPLFRRDYRFVALFFLCFLGGNSLSMLKTGFVPTFNAYRQTIAHHDHYGSPFHPDAGVYHLWRTDRLPNIKIEGRPIEVPGDQVQFTYIFSSWTHNVPSAKKWHLVAAAITLGILTWQWRRMKDKRLWEQPRLSLILFSYLMAVSLITIYHQRYDLIALLPLGLVAWSSILGRQRRGVATIIAVGVTIFAGIMSATLLTNLPSVLAERTGLLAFVPVTGYFCILMAICAGMLLRQEWRHLETLPSRTGEGTLPSDDIATVRTRQSELSQH